jgi:hypothetical protein
MYIYKSKEKIGTDSKNVGTMEQTAGGRWLVRLGLMDLVCGMAILSDEYKMEWAAHWNDHLDKPDWLRRAMANTFLRLKPADKELIRPLYDDWLWFESRYIGIDMKALVVPEFNALCYVLDGEGKRVRRMDGPVTVLRGLKGQDRREALETLNVKIYEFCCWW